MTAASVAAVVELYERWGDETYDEAVGQRAHALQTAALAAADGAAPALVAAALLHDVGHLLTLAAGDGVDEPRGDDRDLRHEDVGAAWLRPLLPATVTRPIALHVRAKRYLCATEPDYEAGLSSGSVRSLRRQGGPFDADAAAAFARLPGAADAVRLRRWDDAGKVDGLAVAPFDDYLGLLVELASSP